MTKTEKGARAYRIPTTTTTEDLEELGLTTLTFGERILVAGHAYLGRGNEGYFGATYRFATDDRTCEGEVRLEAVSEGLFEDDGHAIAWAIRG